MILTREGKSSDVMLGVYLRGFIVTSSYFCVLPVIDMFKALCKNKPVSKQSWKNVENGLIQVFMYSKIIFFKLPVEYIISELKVKLHSSFLKPIC